MAPGVASFCPHCGLAFNNLPLPIAKGQVAGRPPRSGLLWLIWILLGVIGLAAYVYWMRESEEFQPEPHRPRVRIHEYHR
jgi:hypothetical protein